MGLEVKGTVEAERGAGAFEGCHLVAEEGESGADIGWR